MSSKTIDRNTEARSKRLLGAIVVRAGLSMVDRAFLLGGLLELAKLSPRTPILPFAQNWRNCLQV